MNQQALERCRNWMQEQDLAAVLLASPFNVTWLTGYAAPIQTGPSPFEGGPALLWLRADRSVLLTSDMESGSAQASGIEVQDYVAYTIEAPIAGSQNQAAALRALLESDKVISGKVGVEFDYLPAPFVAVLREALPNASTQAIDRKIDPLRAVKSAQEIELIRASLRLCDSAQKEVRAQLRVGMSEIELWNAMKAHIEVLAAGRLPVLADLVAGSRTAEIGGLPGDYQLQAGDPIIVDVVPRLAGYWGDNADTHFVGQPSDELSKIYQLVRETLQRGVDAVRPGVRACDLDEMLRTAIQQKGYPVYPHHSGHGIGTSYHEEPRIVPYNTAALEAGMILALEPGIYLPEIGGVRLEDVLLVTEDGCELLTSHLIK